MSHKKKSSAAQRSEVAAWHENQRAERAEALRIKREQDAVLNAGVINAGLYPVELQTLCDEFDALTRARAYSLVTTRSRGAKVQAPPVLRVVQ